MHLERLIRVPWIVRAFLIALLAGSLALTGALVTWLLRDEPEPADPEDAEKRDVARAPTAVSDAPPPNGRRYLDAAAQARRNTSGTASHGLG